ncbi:DUF5816 domain-containing protein [Haloarchaeobius sp. DFWS5]|uniref:DUF5816 domain-containing protein n=1 Tax=Haloarchaeobius sp. DFWS5 TaxID=3446114 RepID=UPI003EB6D702
MSDAALDERRTDDGETVYVSRREGDRGDKGPFFVTYRTSNQERKYGYFCGNCQTFDNAMDSMGRIKCNECGNMRKPTEWDAAHE